MPQQLNSPNLVVLKLTYSRKNQKVASLIGSYVTREVDDYEHILSE
jgi:hypothetical protein